MHLQAYIWTCNHLYMQSQLCSCAWKMTPECIFTCMYACTNICVNIYMHAWEYIPVCTCIFVWQFCKLCGCVLGHPSYVTVYLSRCVHTHFGIISSSPLQFQRACAPLARGTHLQGELWIPWSLSIYLIIFIYPFKWQTQWPICFHYAASP